MEVLPPGANDTTSVIGRLGKVCADAGRAASASVQIAANRRAIGPPKIGVSDGYCCASAMIREGGRSSGIAMGWSGIFVQTLKGACTAFVFALAAALTAPGHAQTLDLSGK